MIEVEGLTKIFGNVIAVDNVSFDVSKGEIVGFLGPNGAGKTTTMRILSCFFPPTSGKAKVAGYDIIYESMNVRKNIGYLPENVPLYTDMRVCEYLIYRSKMKGVKRKDIKTRIAEVVEKCNISEVFNKIIGHLSKGFRQRVGLADALIHNPPVLILDEPTIGLDPVQTMQTRQVIKNLRQERTILLSTHILSEVEMICDRVIIINKGKIIFSGRMAEVTEKGVGKNKICLELIKPDDNVAEQIKILKGVSSITSEVNQDYAKYFIEVESDLRNEIYNIAVKSRWQVVELRLIKKRLEDLFSELISRD